MGSCITVPPPNYSCKFISQVFQSVAASPRNIITAPSHINIPAYMYN